MYHIDVSSAVDNTYGNASRFKGFHSLIRTKVSFYMYKLRVVNFLSIMQFHSLIIFQKHNHNSLQILVKLWTWFQKCHSLQRSLSRTKYKAEHRITDLAQSLLTHCSLVLNNFLMFYSENHLKCVKELTLQRLEDKRPHGLLMRGVLIIWKMEN